MVRNLIIAVALLSGLSGLVISLYNTKTKLLYIDMGKVYEEFTLSKELNKELENVLKARKVITDSLFEDLRTKTQELKYQNKKTLEDIQKLAKLEEEYYYRQQQYEKDNQATSNDYSAKIWNQLNQFVGDYGKENNCTFIFGANGQGNLMYADKEKNITDEVIAYVNAHYTGQK
jgi:Skp family chaperone for outer membrane proteins